MVGTLRNSCDLDKQIELISPTSVHEVMELKDIIEKSNNFQSQSNTEKQNLNLEVFICVTNSNGLVKYSNFRLKCLNESANFTIIESLNIKCPIINSIIAEINQKSVPENDEINETLLHGHICFINLNKTQIPVILKLQQTMNQERLLIWSFKKASIVEVVDKGFKIDNYEKRQYQFTKFKFVLAIDKERHIINAPNDLLKTLMGREYLCKPKRLEDVIEVSDDLKNILALHESKDSYGKYSTSSLDLAVENSSIFCSTSRFKSQSEMIVSVNLFNPIYNPDFESIFPVQIKYQSDKHDDIEQSKVQNEVFPEFPGLKIIRKISESYQSTIYEALRLFQQENENRVIIKLIHRSNQNEVSPEIEFYEFFLKDPIGCEFIEKPISIENSPKPTILMKSSGNLMDLFDYVQFNKHLTNDVIKLIFQQVAKAIDYLHCNGIVHRDIKVKTSNICTWLEILLG